MKKTIYVILAIAGVMLIGIILVMLISGPQTIMARLMGVAPPDGLDTAETRLSDQGLFKVTYGSAANPIPINRIHSWTIHVETADGNPVEQAEIAVDGGMPQHGHGLPTQPKVTQYLGSGDYQVEGMKFHMPGWWIVTFQISAGGESDSVTFNLVLE